MSTLGRIWEVVRGAVACRRPPEMPLRDKGDAAQRAQVMLSAESVEERARERVRQGSRDVREVASRVIRKIEGTTSHGTASHHGA